MNMTKESSARALAMARRALAILEEQAAGYTALESPTHLRINLEEKRREVAALEARVGGEAGPHDGGSAVFDQRGQQVGTQINVAGDYHAAPPPAPPPAASPGAAPAALRARLQRLDAVELESLCLDHFPQVYDKFARGLRRDEMLNLLLDYIRRNPEDAAKLAALL